MFKPKHSFSGFSIDDLEAAKRFYGDVLGMQVAEYGPGISIQHVDGGSVLAYVKDDHQPAAYTILNFKVEDIDEAVDSLVQAGVTFERYKDTPQDEKGIMRGLSMDMGPDIAWFKDPSGNVLSILQN